MKMTDYTIIDARGRPIAHIREHYDEKFLVQCSSWSSTKNERKGLQRYWWIIRKDKRG